MDNQVKQRVIGAVVLVALAVIFVPMLLEKPDSDLGPVGSNLPEQPDQSVQDRIEPLTLPEPPADEEPAQVVIDQAPPAAQGDITPPADAVAPNASAPIQPAPGQTPPPTPTPAPAPTPTPGAEAPADTAPPAATVPPAANTSPTPTPVPAPTPPAAAPQPAQPPVAATTKPKPSVQEPVAPKPLSGWVVQLASLASKNNALALRERLRGLGYTAFVEELKTSQGGLLYRVRVGPELERANADNLRSRLEQQVQLKGIVTRYP